MSNQLIVPKRQHIQRVMPTVLIAGFAAAFLIEMGGPFVGREGVLVVPVILLMLVLAPLVARSAYTKPPPEDATASPSTPDSPATPEDGAPAWRARKLPLFVLGSALYLVLLPYLGFIIASLMYVPTMMWHLRVRSILLMTVIPIALVVFAHLALVEWLGVNLPAGPLPLP